MNNPLENIFRIPELRKRVLFTLGMIFVFRLGAHIPTPGINIEAMTKMMEQQSGGILGFLDLFSGGAFRNFTVFALGIMPYISASIIIQLLTAVIPALEALSKEGDAGRKKLTQYTRYLTVGICVIQGFGITLWLKHVPNIVISYSMGFQIMTILTLTGGTIFLMWLGEQMTEHGIGNGMSMLIFAGIVARVPLEVVSMVSLWRAGTITLFQILIFTVVIVALTAVAVLSQQSYRRIPVQYAQRIVGRKVYRGQSTQLPIKIDYSGVIAVIFSSSIMIIPSYIAKMLERPDQSALMTGIIGFITTWLSPGHLAYIILYALMIIFFCYFYTAITFNPNDVAENLKKHGGFIPGIRPGQPTADYINGILNHIPIGGALMVVAIAVIPDFLGKSMSIGWYFGGTTMLIVVGVALDTMQQIESHLLMRHYDGFMASGRIKGRRS